MLLLIALLLTLPLAHFFSVQQRKSRERKEMEEENQRLKLLEMILKNNKDRS